MSSAFDPFYQLGSENNNTTKNKGRRRRRRDNEAEENNLQTSVAHKKKVHILGSSQTITIDGVRIDFPLKPYPAQIQMMNKIIRALNKEENALLESPTGSGKSLALLCAAIAWRENQQRKFAAEAAEKASHYIPPKRDLELAMDEAEELTKRTKYTIKTTVIEDDDDDFQQPAHKRFIAEKVIVEQPDTPKIEGSVTNEEIDPSTETAAQSTEPKKVRKIPRIYVGSRTHKQITQLLAELKSNTRYIPRTAVLGSREHLCIHSRVSKSSNKAEDCTKLLDTNSCPLFHKKQKLVNHPSLSTTNRIWDIEDLVRLGKRTQGCPYYASRQIAESAEVIFSPYNYIIDPVIRKVLEIGLEDSIVILDEAHNIEDASRSAGSFETDEETLDVVMKELDLVIKFGGAQEAHRRMEGVIGQIYDMMKSNQNDYFVKEYERQSCHFTGDNLLQKLNEINITPYLFNEVLSPAFGDVAAYAKEVRSQMENDDVWDTYNPDGGAANPDPEEDGVYVKRIRCLSNGSLTILEGIFTVLKFIFDPDHRYANDYQLVLMKTMNRTNANTSRRRKKNAELPDPPPKTWIHKLAFWCLNPAVIFRDMAKNTRSVILTSGTLSPLSTFASELGIEFTGRLEANHVIKPSQVWVSAIPYGPNSVTLKGVYNTLETFQYQDEVGQTLLQIIETIPYGVLCFMPSYKALDILMERWKLTGALDKMKERKMILQEPKGGDKNVFEGILNKFYNQIDRIESEGKDGTCDGALFFAVFRGKVSEGIDFNDNYCRAVVTLGIPFPGFKDLEVILKKEYNNRMRLQSNSKEVLSGSEWYSAQAYRAINQALGRCIRHKNDWGAIILLEERFLNTEHINGLSKWVRGQLKVHPCYADAIEGLKQFAEYQVQEMEDQKQKMQEIIMIDLETDDIKNEMDLDVKVEERETTESPSNGVNSKYFKTETVAVKTETSKDVSNSSALLDIGNTIDPHAGQEQYHSLSSVSKHEKASVHQIEDLSSPVLPDNKDMSSSFPPVPIKIELQHSTSNNDKPQGTKRVMTLMPAQPVISKPFDTQILCCTGCSQDLMRGCSANLQMTNVSDLQSALAITKSTIITELCNPDTWEVYETRLMGVPLDVNKLPALSDVIYDQVDGICYRFLSCVCNTAKPFGYLICAAVNPTKKHHVGKVYLWNGVKSKPYIMETISRDDLNKEVPNSQYSSSNDIFYGL